MDVSTHWWLPNGPYTVFPPKTYDIPDGLHVVEPLADGRAVAVSKPGYKTGYDFRVVMVADNLIIEAPKHTDLLTEFARALEFNEALGQAFIERAFSICAGAEPPSFYPSVGTQRSPEYLLKALKWILAQEDINYPIGRGMQGRRVLADRLVEILGGVALGDVCDRACFANEPPPRRLQSVDYNIVDRIIPQKR